MEISREDRTRLGHLVMASFLVTVAMVTIVLLADVGQDQALTGAETGLLIGAPALAILILEFVMRRIFASKKR